MNPHPILEREFRFTPADLRANRGGYLSPGQELALRDLYRDYLQSALRRSVVQVAWAINLGALAYLLAQLLLPGGSFWQLRGWLFSSTALLYALFVVLAGLVQSLALRPLELGQRRLRMVEGVPRPEMEWGRVIPAGGYRVRYVLYVEGWRFPLQQYESYELLRHATCCRVYFVKFRPRHIVLSMELQGLLPVPETQPF